MERSVSASFASYTPRLPELRDVAWAEIEKLQEERRRMHIRLTACQENPASFLLQMEGIEVTQAIQDMSHSVTLFAGKRTAVRIYLSYCGSPDILVQGGLLARSDSGTLTTVPSWKPALLSAANAGDLRTARLDAKLSLNFILPPELTAAGGWNFSLGSLVDAVTGTSLTVFGQTSREVSFVDTAPLRLRVFAVRYPWVDPVTHAQYMFTPSDKDFDLLFSWLARAYPVAQVIGSRAQIDVNLPSGGRRCFNDVDPSIFCASDVNDQLAHIRRLDVAWGADHRTHYYGMVSDGGRNSGKNTGYRLRGQANVVPSTPDPSAVATGPTGSGTAPSGNGDTTWDTDGSWGDWSCGHELAHTFGRAHPGFCNQTHDDPDYPFSNGQLANSDDSFCGFDTGDPSLGIEPAALPGAKWHDVMTYCDFQWISSYTYEGIHTRLAAEDLIGPPTIVMENLISVIARVNMSRREGQIRYVHPVGGPLPADPGFSRSPLVLLRFKTASGELLNEHHVAVKIDSERDEPQEETGLVDALVVAGPEARQVELVIGGKTVDTFRAGDPPQQIQNMLKSDGPGFLGLSWRPAAGEGVSYAAQVSADDGKTWFTLAVGLKEPRFSVDPKHFPGAKRIQIRIIATNGFAQMVAPTEVFDAPASK
jgi:hypothetical protein